MNPTPEQRLQRFRLPAPSPELRARVLAAARQEWDQPTPAPAWAPLHRSLLAIAAALVLAAAGSWTNHRLVFPAGTASAQAAAAPAWKTAPYAGLTAPRFVPPIGQFVNPKAATAALQSRQHQLRDLMERAPRPPVHPAPDGQTRQFRQNPPGDASC